MTTTYSNLVFWDGVADGLQTGSLTVSERRFATSGSGSDSRDMSGLFAIPGLIDAHIHLCLNPEIRDPFKHAEGPVEQQVEDMRARALTMVRAGITTARDLGGGRHLELRVRDEINAGTIAGPRLICAGQPVTSPGGHCHFWGGEAADTGEAIAVVERQHDAGVDLIKVMATGGNITPGSKPVDSQFDDETLAQVVRAAARYDYQVAAHCHGTNGIRQAAAAGVHTVEHCSWVGEAGWGQGFDEAVVALMAAGDVRVSPTINSGWRRFQHREFVERVQENYRHMKQAGIRLIASTDAGIPNIFHDDLPRALPEFARFAGFSAVEVLRSATSDCADAIGLGDVTGRMAPGYSADFILFDANPLEDLKVLKSPVMVVARGVEILPSHTR